MPRITDRRRNGSHVLRYVCSVLTASLAIVVAAACAPPEPNSASGVCGGVDRPRLDCATEVTYDATAVKGGFEGLGLGLSASSERKALRAIDDETARYVAQVRRLCDEYNKCVIDQATYATRSENLRRRLARVPELLEGVRNSPDDETRRAALTTAYDNIVSDSARTKLELRFSVLARPVGSPSPVAVADGATLATGTRIAFLISVSRAAHVYLFQRSGDGRFTLLFPDPRIHLQNPVPAEIQLSIPPDGASFRLDDRDLGLESVYIVASLEPISTLGSDITKLQASGSAPASLANVAKDPRCATRALSYESDQAADGCARQRGIVLDQSGAQPVSLVARTEAADTTIVQLFSFQHVGQP